MKNLLTGWPEPRAAYVHVPFCRHRCGYCNFSVLAGRDEDYAESYLQALEIELAMLGEPRPVDSLFIGGGTPTHLPPPWLARLLRLVTRWFVLQPGGEFSVEANPSDIEPQRLERLADAGVNRLSLGVQSFATETLQVLERDHDAEIAARAIELAGAQFGNVSCDLIFGSPGQTLAAWSADLQRLLELPLQHVSTYGLTYEKGTRFWSQRDRGVFQAAGENTELAMYKLAIETLTGAGFEHYEISNFAKPGHRCRHNLAYWEGRGWYAAGPGAASFSQGRREVNHRSPTTYVRRLLEGKSPLAETESLDAETWARERLVFGLRMLAGIDLAVIHRETGVDVEQTRGAQIAAFVTDGWLDRQGDTLCLTERGLYLSDSILEKLF